MANRIEELLDVLRVPPGKKINLIKDYDPGFTGKWMKKEEAEETLTEGIQMLTEMQDKLWAQNQYAVLMILQALDAAGKDSTIKHVMSGVNPQGLMSTVSRSLPARNWITIIYGVTSRSCLLVVGLEFLIVLTMKKSWSCAYILSSSPASRSPLR